MGIQSLLRRFIKGQPSALVEIKLSNHAHIHSGAYHFSAMMIDGGRPKVVFHSSGRDDIEITVSDDGSKIVVRGHRVEGEITHIVKLSE